jgi:hypothetical protein
MPAGLFTTTTSASSNRISSGMSSGCAVVAVGAGTSTVRTSPSRISEFALTFLYRECVTSPSSMSRWIWDRE